jgi:hypothetical protein
MPAPTPRSPESRPPGHGPAGSGRAAPRRADRRSRGRNVVLALLAVAVAAGGGALLWLRIAQVQEGVITPEVPPGVTRDPATRARGAALSISGDESRPRADYDPASGTVTVRFQSKYYDPHHTAAYNRQYLATEGRLVVQLVLYNDPDVGTAVAELYRGRRLLATVSGSHDDAYEAYKVVYAPGLP